MTQQQQQQKLPQGKSEKSHDDDVVQNVVTPNTILRRNNKGCKSSDFYNWPEQPFDEMDSPLAVQQHIQQLIFKDPSDIDEILKLPEGQDLGAWKIEHLRLFCMQLNRLATKLQDCCCPTTCNQMTATEQWIFLCAAHKQPNECPAIDYTRHTLDGAASLLNSNKYFPSRVTIKESSVAKLGSVCRRIYRIFSHAFYHHFQVYYEFERETHLCERFSKFVTMYELMPKDTLIVPYEGSRTEIDTTHVSTSKPDGESINPKDSTSADDSVITAATPLSSSESSNDVVVSTTASSATITTTTSSATMTKSQTETSTTMIAKSPSSSAPVTTPVPVKSGVVQPDGSNGASQGKIVETKQES